ncbi:protein phosphatase 2C domain-containing protein [Streptomyces sp. NPDC046759]|uniref:protein phosphatase 2C domain-containing protein n=1 Tax=Streptomyces sp. NPDC046759 TaxID=3155019 RepID=UPI0033DFDE9C
MSQQGGRPARPEDDWWGQLYDDSTEDTGPTTAPDSLDDRFASAKHTVTDRSAAPVDGARPDGARGPLDPVSTPDPAPLPDPAPGRWSRDDDAHADDDGAGGTQPPEPPEPPEAAVPKQRAAQDPTAPPPVTPAAPATPPRQGIPWEAAPASPAATSCPDPAPTLPQPPGRQPPAASLPPKAAAPDRPAPAPLPTPQDPRPPVAPPAPRTPPAREAPSAGETPSAPDTPSVWSEPTDPPAPVAPPRPQDLPPPAIPADPPQPSAAAAPVSQEAVPVSPEPLLATAPAPPSAVDYVGSGPPTYDPEPTALPAAEPDGLGELVADTVLDGARYGACTLRAVSLRGDSARYRGEPRRDSLLTARFGSGEHALVLVAMATGVRGRPDAHLAAAEACRWIGRAVGRSRHRLVEDIRAARRRDLKSGLHRLTDRSLGRLRASAAERGLDPEEYTASLRCLLLPADPDCRTRVFFGVGDGGLFRLRDGEWQDIEPRVPPEDTVGAPVVGFGSPPAQTAEGDRLTMDFGIPTPPSPYEPAPEPPREPFRFRASIARPGDALVMCTAGLSDPLRGEAALCAYLARRWSGRTPPGLAAFLADAQVRVKGYADDRTAAGVWEA